LLSLVACGGGAGATQAPQGGGSAKPQTTAGPAATPIAAATTTTPATGGGQTVDACKLATAAEVSAAYGFKVASATPSGDDNDRRCDYASADGRSEATTFISISAVGAQYMDTVKINKGEPVSGVGDDAWWSTDSFMPGIYFMKGGVLVYASGSVFGPDELVVSLAKTMAGRM